MVKDKKAVYLVLLMSMNPRFGIDARLSHGMNSFALFFSPLSFFLFCILHSYFIVISSVPNRCLLTASVAAQNIESVSFLG